DLTAITRLLDGGTNVEQRAGFNGWTPLLHAIHKRQGDAARLLVLCGADCNARGDRGLAPLIMAAGDGSLGIVRLLLPAGADPRAETRDGVTALTMAVSGGPTRTSTARSWAGVSRRSCERF